VQGIEVVDQGVADTVIQEIITTILDGLVKSSAPI
jgi:hypothetical protein